MSRLKPINKSPKKKNVFHNMAFVIFCPKHWKIAVSDNFDERRELAVWLPFVYLSSDIKKRITVEESIALILSDDNTELMELYTREEPYDANVSYVRDINIEEFKFGFTRTVYLVRLHSDNPVLQCCRKTSRIIWLDIEHILNDNIDCLWGPNSLNEYIRQFDSKIQRVRSDYHTQTMIYDNYGPSMLGKNLLKSLNITEKHIQLFFIDFIEHCFPIIVMSFVSFKDYLGKYGFKTTEKTMKTLFNWLRMDTTFNHYSRSYLGFEDLLIGLACLDPVYIENLSQLELIFLYYDVDGDGYLGKEEFREMIEDIHKNETSDIIDSIVNDYWFAINPFESGVDFGEFLDSVNNQNIRIPRSLYPYKFRILVKIISTLDSK